MPEDVWLKRIKRVRSLVVSRDEFYTIARGFWQRRMVRVVGKSDPIVDETVFILSGALLGVEKGTE